MDFYDQPYYKLSKFFMRVIGRWPNQPKWQTAIVFAWVFFIYAIHLLSEVRSLMFDYSQEVLLSLLAPFCINLGAIFKYFNSFYNAKNFETLIARLHNDWDLCINEEESKILHSWARLGGFLGMGYTGLAYATGVMYVSEPTAPRIISLILKLNDTPEPRFPVPTNYEGLDNTDDYFLILFISALCIVVIVTLLLSPDVLFIVLLHHAFGIFEVIGHRLSHLPEPKNEEKHSPSNMEAEHFEHYRKCVMGHQSAIEYADLLESTFFVCFGLLVFFNMLMITCTMVQVVTMSSTVHELIKNIMFILITMVHLFFDCYLSQELMNKSAAIHEHLNNGKWYNTSLKAQKLIPMIGMRSQRPNLLTAGKIMMLNMENYGVVRTFEVFFHILSLCFLNI
uniref:Odorant receptor n=1 Tax=Aulacocentrum confusum TaxID=2767324 RepID=A0A7G8Z944_9HYME|nr:olfactory receptor 25 [Aulacocentrum confusum]